jgi:lipid II:glycine glycyltransferase (peptidoglycan interpeptide bridge formation enzyme)
MLASIFFTSFRRVGRCIYAGHYDRARTLYGNHILQAAAMQICMERSFEAYDMDVVSLSCDTTPDGVDQYKLGFGSTPVPAPQGFVWEIHPTLCRVTDWLGEQTLVKNGLKALRRRLMRS